MAITPLDLQQDDKQMKGRLQDGQLDGAQVGGKMTARGANAVQDERSQFVGERRQRCVM